MRKFKESIEELGRALTHMEKARKDSFYFGGIAKAFEVCFEYGWKYFKQRVESEGLEVVSPKDAIKKAGQIGVIGSVEKWFSFLDDYNIALQDHFGMPHEEYLKTIQEFYRETGKLSL